MVLLLELDTGILPPIRKPTPSPSSYTALLCPAQAQLTRSPPHLALNSPALAGIEE
jgi:hypothetical protein